MKYLPHRASVGNESGDVRAARGDESGNWTWEFGERLVHIDQPSDFTSAVEQGVEVKIDYGRFGLIVWRSVDGQLHFRGTAGGTTGPERNDDELAMWALLDEVGDAATPRACFFCRWSDIEPSTGWGNLGCFVDRKAAYDEIATCNDPRRRKWVSSTLKPVWVDEWYYCEQFELRPVNYGYRGRPKRG
jgi:hypothetical protein